MNFGFEIMVLPEFIKSRDLNVLTVSNKRTWLGKLSEMLSPLLVKVYFRKSYVTPVPQSFVKWFIVCYQTVHL